MDLEQQIPEDASDEDEEVNESHLEHLRISQQIIREISMATLDDGKLDASVVNELRNPQEDPPNELRDPDVRLSIDVFISCKHASQKTYKSVCESIKRRYPDSNLLSYYSVNKMVAKISGVVSIADDMCVNSCLAYVGPFKDLEQCSVCSEPRYTNAQNNTPVKQLCTIPLGPQIQALRRSPEGAAAKRYCDEKTTAILDAFDLLGNDQIYDDIFSGEDFLAMHERLNLTVNDTTVMFSLDGAQLYQDKKSDTWIAVWIVLEYNPNTRHKTKCVLPALIIPGPNKPKNVDSSDSFMFCSFHHLSALQRENGRHGLSVWDAGQNAIVQSRVIFILGTADAVGLTEIDGRVGHHGAHGCRIGCRMQGRHKPGSGHYYAAHLRPHGINNDHPDFDFRDATQLVDPHGDYDQNLAKLLSSTNQAEYEQNRKLTGLSKPSIISGLRKSLTLSVPKCFTVDLMHLLFLNIGELLISLWRGSLKCEPTDDKDSWDWAVLTGNVWQDHGKLVAAATHYFPSSFHRTPRNPAEKISSGYKATEYFLYVFGLGPALFRVVLPRKYWINLCRLIRGVRTIIQREISRRQLCDAHSFLTQFVEEYENLYYQRRPDRIHFCRPALHTLLHVSPEVFRIGPGACSSQFTLERTIGNLGEEIRQPSNPFGNLCQLALRRSQLNALIAICPELMNDGTRRPQGSEDVGDGYIFLRPRDRYTTRLDGMAKDIISERFEITRVQRWGRIQLPNGQVARSLFSENRRKSLNQRISRNVKVNRYLSVSRLFKLKKEAWI